MGREVIEPEDIRRLVGEIVATFDADKGRDIEPVAEWCKKQNISEDAIFYLTTVLMQLWQEPLAEHIAAGKPRDNVALMEGIEASILMAFSIGWEASREYGSKPA